MQIADFHLHSRYSRACSKDLTIENLEKWGKVKGIDILGSADFTHPKWIQELKSHLKEDTTGEDGIFLSRGGQRFVLSTEIALIYTEGGKGRRIHHVVLAPSFDVVDQLTEYLKKHGRVDYDGRPIFKIPSDEFLYELRKISDKIELIPAHCLTPWFSIFGSNSGYDSVEECFKDQAKHVHALETGISADPPMIYRVPQWRKYTLVSTSDSHSFWPWRIGREATLFDMKKISYDNFIKAIRERTVAGTIEADPSYGKYHFTGHRNCNIVMSPADAAKIGNICPVCHGKLTVGVCARVEALADQPEGYYPKDAPKHYDMLPLSELLAGYLRTTVASKKTWAEYNKLIAAFGNEFNILLSADMPDIIKVSGQEIAGLIIKNRTNDIKVKPGFDGVYGIPVIHGDEGYDFSNVDDEDVKTKEKTRESVVKAAKPDKNQSALDRFF